MPSAIATFRPALPGWIEAEHLPNLPEWWPLPWSRPLRSNPEDPDSADNSAEARGRARHAAALAQACEGLKDGHQERFTYKDAPPSAVTCVEGAFTYVLVPSESSEGNLTYRYAPHLSRGHRACMAAVEEAYKENGPSYIEGATS